MFVFRFVGKHIPGFESDAVGTETDNRRDTVVAVIHFIEGVVFVFDVGIDVVGSEVYF